MVSFWFGAALLAVAGAIVVGGLRAPWAAPRAGALGATIAAGAFAFAWATGGGSIINLSWLPTLGSQLSLTLDPLAAPLVIFVTGLAALILCYTGHYLPKHLLRHHRNLAEQARFCQLMLAFMGAMIFLLLAQDLLLIFAALELTALVSFLLIEFDRENPTARHAASTALIITVGSSLLFLVGSLLIGAEAGTTFLPEIQAWLAQNEISTVAAACLIIGVLGKSAQVPLHFWLPKAMVAPTPVSAYLHSAALVAAGVFVLQRLRFILVAAPSALEILYYVGFASVAVGGMLALISDSLKRILAYSTIAQYGYVSVMLAVGSEAGVVGAPFFIVAHGLCKCALFLTAGAVTSATGIERLSEAAGLGQRMPLVAAASGIAAAGLAGLPLTIGYFKDSLFFTAAAHQGLGSALLATVAAGLTFAYTLRFWLGLFTGRSKTYQKIRPSWGLTAPIVLLAALVVLGGLWTTPLQEAFARAGEVISQQPVSIELRYHWNLQLEMRMALMAWTSGVLLFLLHSLTGTYWRAASKILAEYAGPARWASRLATAAGSISDALYRLELRDLRDRIGTVLLPTAIFAGLGLLTQGILTGDIGSFQGQDLPVAGALFLVAGAALVTIQSTQHLTLVLLLSFIGFSLALTFALLGAPNVALVSVLIETTLTLLFLDVLWQLRHVVFLRTQARGRRRSRVPWVGLIAGTTASLLTWVALANPKEGTVAWYYVKLAETAHARDVVTVILADFRGLDTAGELTVLAVAALGAAAISWERQA